MTTTTTPNLQQFWWVFGEKTTKQATSFSCVLLIFEENVQ